MQALRVLMITTPICGGGWNASAPLLRRPSPAFLFLLDDLDEVRDENTRTPGSTARPNSAGSASGASGIPTVPEPRLYILPSMVAWLEMDELLLYIRLEDHIVVDDEVARAIGVADKSALVALIQDAVAQRLIERWASAGEPLDLTAPLQTLADRALGVRLTDEGQARVNALLDLAHAAGQVDDELDEATRRAFDQPGVDYATLMSDLAKN